MELTGMILFYTGAFMDWSKEPGAETSDPIKILFASSILLCLIKVVYLVRVFSKLNFLVTMLITVCSEIGYFMLLFGIFIVSFAECNHIMEVDVVSYGRLPELVGHCISILRGAMGDFAMINNNESFDLIIPPEDIDSHSEVHLDDDE
jgi:hypothetical protein